MTNPFGSDRVIEVPLPRAPLISVLAQVRWPQLTHLRTGLSLKAIADEFGDRLAPQFPIYQPQQQVQVTITPSGASQQEAGVMHQFMDKTINWRVSFAESFVTLETKQYTSRDDFRSRLEFVLSALTACADIPFATRVGFRYVNRIDEPSEYARLQEMIHPALGGVAFAIEKTAQAQLLHSINEAAFDIDGVKLLTRSAHLPPGATYDPSIEPSSKGQSWTLDIDAFEENQVDFNPSDLANKANSLADVAYAYFRWAVNDKFLRTYGADT